MKNIIAAIAVVSFAILAYTAPAGAQDPVVGTVTSDPATVPEAGEHTVTATGEGFIPETDLLLGSCTSPADELVPGVSTTEEIVAAAQAIDPLANCDLANALTVTTDADGSFTQEVTAEMDANFFLSAGALDGSQQGATWIAIVDAETAAALAVTGVDSGYIALIGGALLLFGFAVVATSRRFS